MRLAELGVRRRRVEQQKVERFQRQVPADGQQQRRGNVDAVMDARQQPDRDALETRLRLPVAQRRTVLVFAAPELGWRGR